MAIAADARACRGSSGGALTSHRSATLTAPATKSSQTACSVGAERPDFRVLVADHRSRHAVSVQVGHQPLWSPFGAQVVSKL